MKVFLNGCEKRILNNISEEVNKDSFKIINSQNQALQEEVIEEGLKFFKASTRLYKLANKLERKAKQNPSVINTAQKINRLANKFEYAEDLYEVGRKEEAKSYYKELKNNYTDLLKILRKEEVREALKKAGVLSLSIAGMIIPYVALNHFFPSLSFSNVNKAAGELGTKDQAFLYLKRAGAFTLCGLPVKATRSALSLRNSVSEEKMLKSVDRLLKDNDNISDDETSYA